MSRNASIEFSFDGVEDVSNILTVLARGVVEFERGGSVSYFVNDDGMFDWLRNEDGYERAMGAIVEAWERGVVSGVLVSIPESEQGGELIFFPERSVVSFSASVNRKIIPGSGKFTDLGWYCEKLIPPLESAGLVEVSCSDYE